MTKTIHISEIDLRARYLEKTRGIGGVRGRGVSRNVYGVPRGGLLAAGICAGARDPADVIVSDPCRADFILDDIVDSGRTRDKYRKYDLPFIGLVDRTDSRETLKDGWIVFPWEEKSGGLNGDATDTVTRMLEQIGEDPKREGLLKTPERVVRSWAEIYKGYGMEDQVETMLQTTFTEQQDEMVIVRDIEFYSTCEHHLQPFFGRADIAYIPDKKVVGVSKLARVLEVYARRMQIQERIGNQVVDALMKHLTPKGAACILRARHLCMCARGVEKQNSEMVTSSLRGVFREDGRARSELMSLLSR